MTQFVRFGTPKAVAALRKKTLSLALVWGGRDGCVAFAQLAPVGRRQEKYGTLAAAERSLAFSALPSPSSNCAALYSSHRFHLNFC